jgi:hypothetical protein
MKKSEELIADAVITFIRFIVGVVIGMFILGYAGGFNFLDWIYGDITWDDWFPILSILILGICSAIWGDKVFRRFWNAFEGD